MRGRQGDVRRLLRVASCSRSQLERSDRPTSSFHRPSTTTCLGRLVLYPHVDEGTSRQTSCAALGKGTNGRVKLTDALGGCLCLPLVLPLG